MLWYKAWLETRFRLVLCLFMVASFALSGGALRLNPRSAAKFPHDYIDLAILALIIPVSALILAGSGINAQTHAGMTQGLHPSTQFTLSLPVSRDRLLWTRAAFGWFLLAGLTALCLVLLMVFTGTITLSALPYMLLGGSAYYALALWLSTFLDEMWSGIISLAITGGLMGYSFAGGPGWANSLTFMMGRSATWTGVLFYFVIIAAMGWAASFNIRRKEY